MYGHVEEFHMRHGDHRNDVNPVFANTEEEPNYLPDTKQMFAPPAIEDYEPPQPKLEKTKPKPVF